MQQIGPFSFPEQPQYGGGFLLPRPGKIGAVVTPKSWHTRGPECPQRTKKRHGLDGWAYTSLDTLSRAFLYPWL
jgi:hypothetical protein